MSDRSPKVSLYVALFAVLYLIILVIVGYATLLLQIETGTTPNFVALFISSSLTSYWFFYRAKRRFYKSEYIEITLGSIAVDITIQICSILIFAAKIDLSKIWSGLLLIFLGHAAILAMSYSFWKAPIQAPQRPNP